MDDTGRALILINPRAGRGEADLALHTLTQALHHHHWHVDSHTIVKGTTPAELVVTVKLAFEHGVRLLIAAGGDGTISLVANTIILSGLGHQLRLGVFPSGTANSFSKELGIPENWNAAAQLLASHDNEILLDAMKMNGHYYFLRIGIGLDAEVIRDTSRQAKRWFGRYAYLHTFLGRLFSSHRHRFHCVLDGKHRKFKATQLFIANGGQIALAPFRIGPGIAFNDGILNICAYDVHTWWHYFVVGWQLLWRKYKKQPLMKFWTIHNRIDVRTRRTLPVQGDGEPCANTPVTIEVIPSALRVIASTSITREGEARQGETREAEALAKSRSREGEAPDELTPLKPSTAPPPRA